MEALDPWVYGLPPDSGPECSQFGSVPVATLSGSFGSGLWIGDDRLELRIVALGRGCSRAFPGSPVLLQPTLSAALGVASIYHCYRFVLHADPESQKMDRLVVDFDLPLLGDWKV